MNYRNFLADLPRWMLVLLLLVSAGNLAGIFAVGVHTDESYYWIWSQRLDWGYYDHPPLVAWMIRLFSELFGNGVLGLRLPAVISWIVTMFVVYRLSSSLFAQSAAGWLAMLVVASIPIFQVGFHIVGPDSPLMLFSALTYYYVYRAIDESSGKFWLLAGLCLGLALLGKYTAVLLPGVIFIALISTRESRAELVRLYPWAGLLLAALIFAPVVFWNYQNEWLSFSYQWGHGTETNKGFSFYKVLDYAVQQMSSVLPWVFIAMMAATLRAHRLIGQSQRKLLPLFISGFWVPLLFFAFTGAISKSMHNWPVIAYIPGSILLGGLLAHWIYDDNAIKNRAGTAVKFSVIASVILSVLVVNLARFPQWAKLLDKPERLAGSSIVAVWGWDKLAQAIKQAEERRGLSSECAIFFIKDFNNAGLGYYHVAGEMAFHLNAVDRILLEPVPHQKQYNFWPNTKLPGTREICMIVSGPSNAPEFPKSLNNRHAGLVELEKIVPIVLPDTTSTHYAIYLKKSGIN